MPLREILFSMHKIKHFDMAFLKDQYNQLSSGEIGPWPCQYDILKVSSETTAEISCLSGSPATRVQADAHLSPGLAIKNFPSYTESRYLLKCAGTCLKSVNPVSGCRAFSLLDFAKRRLQPIYVIIARAITK